MTDVNTENQARWLEALKLLDRSTVTALATAGAETYTAAQIIGGIIERDPNGASRTDTLPTAALLVGAMPDPQIGDTLRCVIINYADAAETITIAAGSGGAFGNQPAASKVIAQNASGDLFIRVTGVAASAAYTCHLSV